MFQKDLFVILNKFGQPHTLQQGIDELRHLMETEITENDRMVIFLAKLTEFNPHTKVQQMQEMIKMFGVAAEIFEDSLIEFIPKILMQLEKKCKEEATVRLSVAISETVG